MKLFVLLLLVTTNLYAGEIKVLFMINEGFFAVEYFVPLRHFQKAGFKVKTAASEVGLILPDKRNRSQYPGVQSDLSFADVNPNEYDAIVFAGGNGAWKDYFPDENVHKILTHFMKSGKVTALLCSSTGLLGVANNFNGRGIPLAQGLRATGYFRVEGLLAGLGKVKYEAGESGKPHVVIDKNLITGRDPVSAELFGHTVVEELLKK